MTAKLDPQDRIEEEEEKKLNPEHCIGDGQAEDTHTSPGLSQSNPEMCRISETRSSYGPKPKFICPSLTTS